METTHSTFKGPHPGILAIIFMVLFITGLSFVTSITGTGTYYPGPWESGMVITDYFQNHSQDTMLCAFFQFGSAVPLALFTATIVSRLKFLGVKAAGVHIALVGGLIAAISILVSSQILWVMSYPGIAQEEGVLRALYYVVYAIGGAGYSVPLGLLIAGIAVTCWFSKLLPTWLVVFGMIIAVVGELSWLSLLFPKLVYLIPLTRFPAFIWLILVGFMLPKVER